MLDFKIDTKEKFVEIQPLITQMTANMAELLVQKVKLLSAHKPHHVIINMHAVQDMEPASMHILAACKDYMYTHNYSLVTCLLQPNVDNMVTDAGMEEALNITPTLSEAWDIVQMDEIEREFGEEG